MPPLPSPLRAVLGMAATALDEAKHLPDKAIELPVLAISRALQLSLRAQQRYTAFAARGDEILSGRHTTDAPPAWATFDEPVDEVPTLAAAEPDAAPKPRKPRPRKTVHAPRTGTPSAFDSVGDDE